MSFSTVVASLSAVRVVVHFLLARLAVSLPADETADGVLRLARNLSGLVGGPARHLLCLAGDLPRLLLAALLLVLSLAQ